MPLESQEEFFFTDDLDPSAHLGHPLEDFFTDVAKTWGIPVGEQVCVRLRDPAMPELRGRLELACAPDLPLDPRQPLALRLSGVDFNHRELDAWSLRD